MVLEMNASQPVLTKEAMNRFKEARDKQLGGARAAQILLGPTPGGAPPGPNGQWSGGAFPIYGPVSYLTGAGSRP
jgi:hypothetical protein